MNLNALILGIAVIALTLFGITQGSELSKSEFGQKGTFNVNQASASWQYLLALGPLGTLSTFKIVENGKKTIIPALKDLTKCAEDHSKNTSC
jgi:hypothetical protein|tara:strand:- start:1897 stop:2172 length:276 start_codon:yes stop_codon:yes gene_type:complete